MPGKRNRNLFRDAGKRKPSKAVKTYVDNKLEKLGERKYLWLQTGGVAVKPLWSNTTISGLFLIPQGTNDSERIGQKIQPVSCHLKLNAYRGLGDSHLRIIFTRWINPTVTLGTTSILEGMNDGNVNFITAPFRLKDNVRKRFEVLYDKTVLLDDARNNGVHIDAFVKVSSKPIYYADGTANSSANGQIFMHLISDNPLTSAPTVSYDLVMKYRDL